MRKLLLLSFGMALLTGVASASTVYGLSTRDELVQFDTSNPSALAQASFISGLASNESLLGIDFRPATGELYALGSFGNLYTLNTSNGMATFVAGLTSSTDGSAIQLDGVEFGFDFNPTVDRIRIHSDQNQNFRANPITGVTITDGTLSNTGGGNPNITGSAYTNSVGNATSTMLYNIDSVTDMLTVQNPANAGTNTDVGSLNVDVTALVGFDILTIGNDNLAYGAFQLEGQTSSWLYGVDLGSGATTNFGMIGNSQSGSSLAIRDIALEPIPEPATIALVGFGLTTLFARRKRKS